MNKVYIFFGPPSSGKSYLGKKFAELHDYIFYEADDDYIPEYRERVKLSEDEKQRVYDEFYSKVISKIAGLLGNGKSVVIASALGKNKNRERFIEEFGESVVFILVKSDTDLLLKNAINREFPLVEGSELTVDKKQPLENHLLNKIKNFERPDFDHIVIENDYTDSPLNRLLNIQ